MLPSEFLKSVDLSGLLLHTKEVPLYRESYFILRLKDTKLTQRYIVLHEDHTRSKRRALSIDRYYHTLNEAMVYLDGVGKFKKEIFL